MPAEKKKIRNRILTSISPAISFLLQVGAFALTLIPGSPLLQIGLALAALFVGTAISAIRNYSRKHYATSLDQFLLGTACSIIAATASITLKTAIGSVSPAFFLFLAAGLVSAIGCAYMNYRASQPKPKLSSGGRSTDGAISGSYKDYLDRKGLSDTTAQQRIAREIGSADKAKSHTTRARRRP